MLKPVLSVIIVLLLANTLKAQQTDTLNADEGIFEKVEVQPQFPGGVQAFGKYLATNLRYPAKARENNIQGRVYTTFVVEKDGTLTNIKIIKGIGSGCEEEVIRVLNHSPKWSPGQNNGQPVRVQYSVPIAFHIANNTFNTFAVDLALPVAQFGSFNPLKKDVDFKTDTLVAYFKYPNDVISADQKQDADYFTIIFPPVTEKEDTYTVKEFYKNGKVKFLGQLYNKPLPVSYQGECMYFYPDGKKQAIVTYSKGFTKGMQYFFHPNGVVYAQREILKDGTTRYITCRDSTGNVLAENGEGKWVVYNNDFSKVISSGNVKNGKFDGEWISYPDSVSRLNEVYKKGAVISKKYYVLLEGIYIGEDEIPMYKGSFEELSKYLKKNLKYPREARAKKIAGRVRIEFIVKPDGVLTNFNITEGLGYGLDEEVLRVFKSSGPWMPNPLLKKTNIKYTMMIGFDLSGGIETIYSPGYGNSHTLPPVSSSIYR